MSVMRIFPPQIYLGFLAPAHSIVIGPENSRRRCMIVLIPEQFDCLRFEDIFIWEQDLVLLAREEQLAAQ